MAARIRLLRRGDCALTRAITYWLKLRLLSQAYAEAKFLSMARRDDWLKREVDGNRAQRRLNEGRRCDNDAGCRMAQRTAKLQHRVERRA
jgi:hypothetical protein